MKKCGGLYSLRSPFRIAARDYRALVSYNLTDQKCLQATSGNDRCADINLNWYGTSFSERLTGFISSLRAVTNAFQNGIKEERLASW